MVGVIRNGQLQTDSPIGPTTLLTGDIRFYYIDFEFARRFEIKNEASIPVLCRGGQFVDTCPELNQACMHISDRDTPRSV